MTLEFDTRFTPRHDEAVRSRARCRARHRQQSGTVHLPWHQQLSGRARIIWRSSTPGRKTTRILMRCCGRSPDGRSAISSSATPIATIRRLPRGWPRHRRACLCRRPAPPGPPVENRRNQPARRQRRHGFLARSQARRTIRSYQATDGRCAPFSRQAIAPTTPPSHWRAPASCFPPITSWPGRQPSSRRRMAACPTTWPRSTGCLSARRPHAAAGPRRTGQQPRAFMRGLKAHRKMRERAILERLRQGDRSIPEIVADIYRDTDPRLHGAAALSVLAHLEDLVGRGQLKRTARPQSGGSSDRSSGGAGGSSGSGSAASGAVCSTLAGSSTGSTGTTTVR